MSKSTSFCTNCGVSLKPTTKFCGSCGTKKEATDEYVSPKQYKQIKKTERMREKPRKQELKDYEEEYLSRLESSSKSKSKTGSKQDSDYDAARHRRSIERPAGWKSEGTTLILAIILGILGLSGVGHLYLGVIGRGVGILIGGLVLLIVGAITTMFVVGIFILIAYIPLFIWQIIDARRLCRQYNDYYEEYGEEPNW